MHALHPLALAEKHPVEAAAVIVVGGLLILYVLRKPASGTNTNADASASAAYYAAHAATAQAGDAVQIAQIQATAATVINGQNTAASTANATTWSSAAVTQTDANDATQVSLAPFAVENNLVNGLTTAAQAPPITTTTSSQSEGPFFGIFGGNGSHTTTTVSPNPVATSAIDQLDALINGFTPGH